jgi:hypothetical protein
MVVQEAQALVQTMDCEKSELSEKRSVHIKEATPTQKGLTAEAVSP